MQLSITAQVAAMQAMSTPELKAEWRRLFESEPPAFNRRFLESRLIYRVQELALGGLKPSTVAKLEALAAGLDGKAGKSRSKGGIPVAGTRLIREFAGVEHVVTVVVDGTFEYQGRRYNSLSAIARAITGTRWNGPLFFGLRRPEARS